MLLWSENFTYRYKAFYSYSPPSNKLYLEELKKTGSKNYLARFGNADSFRSSRKAYKKSVKQRKGKTNRETANEETNQVSAIPRTPGFRSTGFAVVFHPWESLQSVGRRLQVYTSKEDIPQGRSAQSLRYCAHPFNASTTVRNRSKAGSPLGYDCSFLIRSGGRKGTFGHWSPFGTLHERPVLEQILDEDIKGSDKVMLTAGTDERGSRSFRRFLEKSVKKRGINPLIIWGLKREGSKFTGLAGIADFKNDVVHLSAAPASTPIKSLQNMVERFEKVKVPPGTIIKFMPDGTMHSHEEVNEAFHTFKRKL